jgi:hypothetical protein
MNGLNMDIMTRDFIHSQDPRLEAMRRTIPPRVPPAAYRHATPSGPWPWMDLDSEVDRAQLEREHHPQAECDHVDCDRCWLGYPQSLFGNWTPDQVDRSKIQSAIEGRSRRVDRTDCVIYTVDMMKDGSMANADSTKLRTDEDTDEFWEKLVRNTVRSKVFVNHCPAWHLCFMSVLTRHAGTQRPPSTVLLLRQHEWFCVTDPGHQI